MPRVTVAAYAVLVVAFVALGGGDQQPHGAHALKLNARGVLARLGRGSGGNNNKSGAINMMQLDTVQPQQTSMPMPPNVIELQKSEQEPSPVSGRVFEQFDGSYDDEDLRTFPDSLQPGMLVQVEGLNKEYDDEHQRLNGLGCTLLEKNNCLDRPCWEAYFSHNGKVYQVLEANLKFICECDAQKKFAEQKKVFMLPTFYEANIELEAPHSMKDRICTLNYYQTRFINNNQWIIMCKKVQRLDDGELFEEAVFHEYVNQSHMMLLPSDEYVEGILEKERRRSTFPRSGPSPGMLVEAEGLLDEKLKKFNGRKCTLLTLVNVASVKYTVTLDGHKKGSQALSGQWLAYCPQSAAVKEHEILMDNIIRLPRANMKFLDSPKDTQKDKLPDGQLVYYDHGEQNSNDVLSVLNKYNLSLLDEPQKRKLETLDILVLQGVCMVKTVETVRWVVCPYGASNFSPISFTLDDVAEAKLIAIPIQ